MNNDYQSGRLSGSESLGALLGERTVNLRQTLLRAHRGMNNLIEEKFRRRGYSEMRAVHLSVLANMDLGETNIKDLSDRAQMTAAGVRDILSDLVNLGYVRMVDADKVEFSDSGWELMLTSFNIQKELEAEFASRLRAGDLEELRRILRIMFESK
jgi:DNA-binding MarR family transcriptional regulator